MTSPTRLQTIWERSQRNPGVVSPCISVCRMDGDGGLCQGCYRSLDEIAAWSTMSDDQRRVVWSAVLQREQSHLEAEHERPR